MCLAIADVAVAQPAPAAGSVFALDRQELVFGAFAAGQEPAVVTPPQRVFLEAPSQQRLRWTAVADRSWLDVQPAAGTLPARLTVSVRPSFVTDRGHGEEGQVVVTADNNGAALQQIIRVVLRVLREPHAPIGAIDAPPDGTVVKAATRLSGWALHDVGLSRVAICHDPPPRSSPSASDQCGDNLIHLGDAAIYYNARPDVAALSRDKPFHERSGWTYVVDPRSLAKRARGTLRIYPIATGLDGSRAVLGVRTITVLPDAEAELHLGPHAGGIIGLLGVGLALHILLRWYCLPRLRHDAAVGNIAAVRVSPIEYGGIAAIVALFLSMNLPKLTGALTYDELYTASHYAVGVPLWTPLLNANTFTNHIAYSLLAAISVRIVGASEFALRLPAVLLGAGAIYALWRYTRSWAGPGMALAGALILALLPFHTQWSRMARGYTGVALMTVLAMHGLRRVIRHGSGRGAVEHAVGLVLAMYFHLYAAWVFLVQYALFVLFSLRSVLRPIDGMPLSRRSFHLLWLSFLCAAAVTLVLYAPVASGLLGALPMFSVRGAIRGGLFLDVFNAFAGADSRIGRIAIGALFLLGAAYVWRRSRLDAFQLIALIVVPVCLVILVIRPRSQYERYYGYWSPACALLIAGGLSLLATRPAGRYRARAFRLIGPAIAAIMLVFLGVDWVRRDARAGRGGEYGEQLQSLNDAPPQPVFAVGADSEMFQFYVRQPLTILSSVEELEQIMVERPSARVAYHKMRWNSAEQRRMGAILEKRCPGRHTDPVAIYECGP